MNSLEWHVDEDGEAITPGPSPTPPGRNNRRTAGVVLALALVVAAAITYLTASPAELPDQVSPTPTSPIDELLMADLMTLQAPAQSMELPPAPTIDLETQGPELTAGISAPDETATELPLPESLPTSTPLLPLPEYLPTSTPLVPLLLATELPPVPSPAPVGVQTPSETPGGPQTPGVELTATPTITPALPTATEVPGGPYPPGGETPAGPYP